MPNTVSNFKMKRGTSLETLWRARASSCDEGETTWFFSSCDGIVDLRRGIQVSSCVGPGKSILPFEVRGRAGDCSRVTSGRNRGLPLRRCRGQGPHLAKRWEPRGFLELRRHSRVATGISAFPLGWPWEAQASPRLARESWGLRLSHCGAEETSPKRVSGT